MAVILGLSTLLTVVSYLIAHVHGYFLIGANVLTVQRIDPIISPGGQSSHTHRVVGGSKFGLDVDTATLRDSECTSIRIKEDKSAYWIPNLYFQWANESFTSVSGGFVIYYLFGENDDVTAFPDDFQMISGTTGLRSYDDSSAAQQAVTYLCLDFEGKTTGPFPELPAKKCASGVRSQINFPSCWNGKDVKSDDHKSHVSFPTGGPDSGSCPDDFPVQLPRIFMEVYWNTDFDFDAAKNPEQPFVFANGDSTGYGYHADFINGWEAGVLQKVVEECTCDIYGDPTCCANAGLFTLQDEYDCKITNTWDEQVEGWMEKLPGNNPVTGEGPDAPTQEATCVSPKLSPVYEYIDTTEQQGEVVDPGTCAAKEAKRVLKHRRREAIL